MQILIDSEKLDKIFHDVLNIIVDLRLIDTGCQITECSLRKKQVHESLLLCQKKLVNLREEILKAIEEK